MDFFGPNKSLLLVQLLLLVSISACFFPSASGVFSDSKVAILPHLPPAPTPAPAEHHRRVRHPPPHHKDRPVKRPVLPPIKPPAHPPVFPPVQPPVKPPVLPPVHPPVKPPVQPPVMPPVHPPVEPPVFPPALPPVKPPVHPPVSPPQRSSILVEGVVFCKSCKYKGKNTLVGAKPIYGAVVKLVCKNTMKKLVQTAKTNSNGYFLIMAPKTVSSYAYHKCKVSLVWSPLSSCKKPSTLNGGKNGAFLRPRKSFLINKLPYTLYSVGPFGFEPTCPRL